MISFCPPSVENLLCRECYQRLNTVEGETRNSAISKESVHMRKKWIRRPYIRLTKISPRWFEKHKPDSVVSNIISRIRSPSEFQIFRAPSLEEDANMERFPQDDTCVISERCSSSFEGVLWWVVVLPFVSVSTRMNHNLLLLIKW